MSSNKDLRRAKHAAYEKKQAAKGLRCGSPWIAHQAC